MKKSTSFAPMCDRYRFDFKMCTPSKGWAQFDTRQDASYHGIWVNPITREYVSYVEGDVCHIEYDNDEEMSKELRVAIEWHTERGYFVGIDGMCNEEIKAGFKRLGLEEFLH